MCRLGAHRGFLDPAADKNELWWTSACPPSFKSCSSNLGTFSVFNFFLRFESSSDLWELKAFLDRSHSHQQTVGLWINKKSVMRYMVINGTTLPC